MVEVYRSFAEPRRNYHKSVAGDCEVSWYVGEDNQPHVMDVRTRSGEPAYRLYSDRKEPLTSCDPGYISFDAPYPGMAEARDRLAGHDALWDALRRDYMNSLTPSDPRGCINGRTFSAAEQAAFELRYASR